MRVLPESGARQNYNLGDVIPLRRNGLHIPSREDGASGGGGGGGGGTMAGLNIGETSSWRSRWKAIDRAISCVTSVTRTIRLKPDLFQFVRQTIDITNSVKPSLWDIKVASRVPCKASDCRLASRVSLSRTPQES
ncbi:hypothetical protein WN51_13764 [Melipona quadrifasciata]|uniref:Uncharacterized protein n=1 Tax=Melipona quadrifasciata TaxID=166423 RepID=A0A0M9A080_9HYME|nr:hypothetical protein WN51_13764 [Melipona quadrifasciata]